MNLPCSSRASTSCTVAVSAAALAFAAASADAWAAFFIGSTFLVACSIAVFADASAVWASCSFCAVALAAASFASTSAFAFLKASSAQVNSASDLAVLLGHRLGDFAVGGGVFRRGPRSSVFFASSAPGIRGRLGEVGIPSCFRCRVSRRRDELFRRGKGGLLGAHHSPAALPLLKKGGVLLALGSGPQLGLLRRRSLQRRHGIGGAFSSAAAVV